MVSSLCSIQLIYTEENSISIRSKTYLEDQIGVLDEILDLNEADENDEKEFDLKSAV